MNNFYDKLDWNTMLCSYSAERKFDVEKYHKILCPEFPDFLQKYIDLPVMQRLKDVGLLCGTDWTALYKNRFYYSRLEHSIGTALIVWNFTKDKIQSLAALFHDIAIPAFSHSADFRKGDALTQTSTESETEKIIINSKDLCSLLKSDGLEINKVCDYHIYPIADNEIPRLSADRLEYMFPSGASLHGSWTIEEVGDIYKDIKILKNEDNIEELGFSSVEAGEVYCEKFLETGHILQLNENKLALQLLAEICNKAIHLNLISEEDTLILGEQHIIDKFESYAKNTADSDFARLFFTFRNMKKIIRSQNPVEGCFCVRLDVKQRYINPLVLGMNKNYRIAEISKKADSLIKDFLNYKDSPYGCVLIDF